jgi:hypothetical protein
MEFRKKSDFDKLGEELGMTPEQVKQAIADQKKEKERADKLETDLNTTKTTLSTMEGSFRETKQRLDDVEANFNKNKNDKKEDPPTRTSFIDDEDKAFNERFSDKIGPVAATALIAAKNSARMAAKMSLQGKHVNTPGGKISLTKLWDKWENEIDKDSKDVAMAALGDMQTWINLFNYVKGKHFDEMMAEPKTFIESVETNVDRRVGETRDENEKLNTEEEGAIKKMSKYSKHITPEKYQEMKKKMTFVNV